MDNRTNSGIPLRVIDGAPLLQHSTDDLDLNCLPERLNDTMLVRVKEIADAPLPALPTCDERHFAKCLRIMLAVLPKQNTDDLGAELFVETYRRQIGHLPAAQISFITDKATRELHWFPTIAQCLEIAKGWHRSDDAVLRKRQAQIAVGKEEAHRRPSWNKKAEPVAPMTQEEVDALPAYLVRLGISIGYLRNEDGKVVYAPEDGE